MAQMNFYIYIDSELMKPDPQTGLPKLANLSLVRKVAGTANVVFQSKTVAHFSDKNQFTWEQKYQIGASQTPPQPSAFVNASTGPKDIKAGQMCDWSSVIAGGPPLQYMPDAKAADPEFLKKYPASTGMFGTKNQPDMWYNSVWCATGGSNYSCIYTDTVPPVPGLNYRAYLVENKYQVSWESTSVNPGIFTGSWSNPWEFSIPPGATTKYVSWGYPTDSGDSGVPPQWFDYGDHNPGKHDPSKSIGGSGVLVRNDLVRSPFHPVFVSMRLGWDDNEYTAAKQRENATAMMAYLKRSTSGWLVIQNVYIGTWVSADVGLRPNTSFGDYVPGETESDKLRFYLRSLVNNIAPRYGPTDLNWNYGASITSNNDTADPQAKDLAPNSWSKFFKLFWRRLPAGSGFVAATASANFLQSVIQQELRNRYDHSATMKYEKVDTYPDHTASTVFEVTGLSPSQFNEALVVVKSRVLVEHDRNTPIPDEPDVPTPDDVKVTPDTNASFEDVFPSGQNREQYQEAPNGQGRGGEDYSKPRLVEGGQQQYPEANGHYQQGQGYKYSIPPAVASY